VGSESLAAVPGESRTLCSEIISCRLGDSGIDQFTKVDVAIETIGCQEVGASKIPVAGVIEQ